MKRDELHDANWLREKYLDKRLSTIEIARLVGVPNDNATTVRRALIRAGIPLRSIADAKRGKSRYPARSEKPCTRCGIVKPLGDFYANRKSCDGRLSHCKKCNGEMSNESARQIRARVLAELGGKCVWDDCGITDERILAIDHINGGGTRERKASTKGVYGYYKSMLGRLEEFQVLCWNHNHLKRILEKEHRAE